MGVKNKEAALTAAKLPYKGGALSKQISDVCRRAIAKPQPYTFWRRSQKHGSMTEILILGNNHKIVGGGIIPDIGIVCARQFRLAHMPASWKFSEQRLA